jgi:hypothetical protein
LQEGRTLIEIILYKNFDEQCIICWRWWANQYLTCSVDEEEATGKEENPIKVYQVSFTRGHLK